MSEIPGFKKTLDEKYKLHKAKNNDYAGVKDPYKNFRLCETLGVCSIEQGILVRISDKLSRVTTLLKSDIKVKDEKITDTLLDMSNYIDILKCYLEHNN